MLNQWIGAVPASTYAPIAVGAVLAGTGVIGYLLTFKPPADAEDEIARWPQRQQLALRLVTGVYLALAVLLLIVSVILGGPGFVLTAVLLVVLAAGSVVGLWKLKTTD